MLPLTQNTPKPLLELGGLSLLERQIRRLERAGITEIVINVSYLAEQIVAALDAMPLDGLTISVSKETAPLETGGALLHAQSLLGANPFVLVNADAWSDFDFLDLSQGKLRRNDLAHLVLVPNPEHNPDGDFCLDARGRLSPKNAHTAAGTALTFSGISIVDPRILALHDSGEKKFPLRDLLLKAMQDSRVSGELYTGEWADAGTPERLEALNRRFPT